MADQITVTGPAPRLAHMPGLDGLRGLAVLAVVLFHGGHLQGGYLGVDLFFVLSGFLITSLLLVERAHSDRIALARFWGRRARRLLPALGVMLVGVAAYAGFAAEPEELHRIRWDGLATMLYVANWREILAGFDYWALFTSPSPLAHTWSLTVEPLRVVGAGQPDCQYPPAEGIRYEDGDTRGGDQLKACDAHWARTVDAYRPDEVIFVRNGLDPTEILVDGTYLRPCTPAFEAHHLAALRADVERFAEAGATTVLVTSPPSHQHLGLTDEYYERYLDAVECGNDVRRQVAESMPDTKLVDLEAYLCTSERTCRRELDGSELRGDGTHFKGRAARLVAAWILNEIGIEASADP